MKLKYDFESIDMGDEIIFVPVGDGARQVHGVLKLNAEGKEILDLLKEKTTEHDIINELSAKYENDRQTLVNYVRKIIHTLQEAGLIEE